jgi:Ca2+-binding RTX toxin-like protein
MALQPDPSGLRRLIGDNTSEFVTLSIADAANFPVGVWMLAGNDTVNGSTANDLVYGNEGEDLIIRNSGDIVGFVENVRVADLQGSIISVQGF